METTFNLSEETINAITTKSNDKDLLLMQELKLKRSKIREVIEHLVPNDFELDDAVELRSLNFHDDESGSIDVKYTYRRYIGDGEDEDNSEIADIDFAIHPQTLEVTLSCEGEA